MESESRGYPRYVCALLGDFFCHDLGDNHLYRPRLYVTGSTWNTERIRPERFSERSSFFRLCISLWSFWNPHRLDGRSFWCPQGAHEDCTLVVILHDADRLGTKLFCFTRHSFYVWCRWGWSLSKHDQDVCSLASPERANDGPRLDVVGRTLGRSFHSLCRSSLKTTPGNPLSFGIWGLSGYSFSLCYRITCIIKISMKELPFYPARENVAHDAVPWSVFRSKDVWLLCSILPNYGNVLYHMAPDLSAGLSRRLSEKSILSGFPYFLGDWFFGVDTCWHGWFEMGLAAKRKIWPYRRGSVLFSGAQFYESLSGLWLRWNAPAFCNDLVMPRATLFWYGRTILRHTFGQHEHGGTVSQCGNACINRMAARELRIFLANYYLYFRLHLLFRGYLLALYRERSACRYTK